VISKQSKIFKGDIHCDKKGLIFEAYNIENVDESSCRIIFFDWIISLDPSINQNEAINELLEAYSQEFPNHPMTRLLIEGIDKDKGRKQRRRAKSFRGAIL
tara:strand:- start:277 stop:579 length:303 start_codon:yes stop_codon:yes gene_type:complete